MDGSFLFRRLAGFLLLRALRPTRESPYPLTQGPSDTPFRPQRHTPQ